MSLEKDAALLNDAIGNDRQVVFPGFVHRFAQRVAIPKPRCLGKHLGVVVGVVSVTKPQHEVFRVGLDALLARFRVRPTSRNSDRRSGRCSRIVHRLAQLPCLRWNVRTRVDPKRLVPQASDRQSPTNKRPRPEDRRGWGGPRGPRIAVWVELESSAFRMSSGVPLPYFITLPSSVSVSVGGIRTFFSLTMSQIPCQVISNYAVGIMTAEIAQHQ